MSDISVFLVDDDMLAVNYIKDIIDWEQYNFTVVGTAYNGKQALEQIREKMPQVLITDISMPLMDGIRLTHEVRKFIPEIKVLLLTAYSEFNYAKAAIHEGVDAYLIKDEITPDSLLEVLNTIKVGLENLKETSNIVKEKIIQNYLLQDDDSCIRTSNTTILYKKYKSIMIQFDLALIAGRIDIRTIKSANKRNIVALCSEILQLPKDFLSIALPENRMLLIWEEDSIALDDFTLDRLLKRLNKNFDGKISLFYTSSFQALVKIRDYLRDANMTREHVFLNGSGKTYAFTKVKKLFEDEFEHKKYTKSFAYYLKNNNDLDFSKIIYEYFSAMNSLSQCIDGIRNVFEYFNEKITLDKIDKIQPLKNLINKRIYDISEAKQIACEIFGVYQEQINKINTNYRREVKSAVEFVKVNYHKHDLQNTMIADYVGLSSSRLSVVFKKETGMTLNQYILYVRMEKAKQLLESEKYRVYEIAHKVGFDDTHYFNKAFRKTIKISPTEYQRKLRG